MNTIRQGTRYSLLSLWSFAASIGMAAGFQRIGVPEEIGFALTIVIASGMNFLGFRYYVFSGHGQPFLSQLIAFIFSAAGFRASEFLAFVLAHTLAKLPYLPTIAVILICSSVGKFFFFRVFVFRGHRPQISPVASPEDS